MVRQGVGMVTEKQDVESKMVTIPQAPSVLEPPEHKGANGTCSYTVPNIRENNM